MCIFPQTHSSTSDLCAGKTCPATECERPGACTNSTGLCSDATPKPDGSKCSLGTCWGGLCRGQLLSGAWEGDPGPCCFEDCVHARLAGALWRLEWNAQFIGWVLLEEGLRCFGDGARHSRITCLSLVPTAAIVPCKPAGLCETVTCPAGHCQNPGACNSTTGNCSSPTPKPNGAPCDGGGVCQGGVCQGPDLCAAITCPASQCEDPGVCNSATGTCSQPTPKADGAACSGGACQGGSCQPSGEHVCCSSGRG